jgi:hypothetical protein
MPYKYNPFTGNLDLTETGGGGGGVTQLDGDVGSATPSGGAITIAGSTGLSTVAAASTVTISLDVPIDETLGGTGQTTYAVGDILFASAANTLSKLTAGTEGYVLTVTGGIPMWQDNGTGDVESVTGTVDRITSSGGANPVIDIAATYIGQASITTLGTITTGTWNADTITVPYGGTGSTSLTQHRVLLGNGTSAIAESDAGTNGQLLIGSTGAAPAFSDLGLGTGITTSGGPNSLTVSVVGGGLLWNEVTIASANMSINNGYVANRAGLVTLTLPASSGFGSKISVTGINTAVGWRIAQGAGQQIYFGTTQTTAGAGGYLESTNIRDTVDLICVVQDLTWNVVSSIGNITVN